MTAKAGGTVDCPEWDEYVQSIRDLSAGREVDYIGKFTALEAAGDGAFKGLSPFRTEKTPSFYVWPGKGCWDFGSRQGGDLIAFERQRNGVSFREACDNVARFFGADDWEARKAKRGATTDPEALAAHLEEESSKERIFAALTFVAQVCARLLPCMARQHVIEHYGYLPAFLEAQMVGYCPSNLWEVLEAEPHPFSADELLATGMFVPLGDGTPAPTFDGRIVFFYWKDGFVRYAIGREYFGRARRADVLPGWYEQRPWDAGKYKKLPTRSEKRPHVSPFIQNSVLWGEDCLRLVRAGDTLAVSEGVTDAGMLAQAGFPVISPVTVAFRNEDVERVLALIKRYRIAKVVILNDNDTTPDGKHPGLDGAKRMAKALWAAGVDVRIARLPRPEGATKIDVNEIGAAAIREGGIERAKQVLGEIIAAALPYPAFLLAEADPHASFEAIEELVGELGTLTAGQSALKQVEMQDRIIARFPKLPKVPARRLFRDALTKEEARRKAESKEEAATAAAAKPARAPRSRIRGYVGISTDGFYYERDTGLGRERISSFRLHPVKRVASDRPREPARYLVRVETGDWSGESPRVLVSEWTIPNRAWVSRHAFAAARPHEEMVFTGTDDDVQGILEILAAVEVPTIRSTGVLGRHTMPDGTLRFVLPSGTMGPDGQWMTEPDLIYLPDGGSNLQHRLPGKPADLASPEALAVARQVLEDLVHLHDPEAMVIMGAFFAASLFAPFIRQRFGVFPGLNVYATPGSGKSSLLARVFWPAFTGVLTGEPLSCTATAFAYARDFASANALALFLDEFKQDMGARANELLVRYFRRLFTGDTETRGRPDQDVAVYPLAAPYCVAGESRLEGDQAMNERLLVAGLSANWLPRHPEAKERFQKLASQPVHLCGPLFQSWSIRADAPAMLTRAEELLATILARLGRTDLPARVRTNLTVLCFGAVALDTLAEALGTKVGDAHLGKVVDRACREIFGEEEGTGQATRVRNYLDELYIEASHMAVLGVITEGKHYVWVDGKLRLWLPGIEAARDRWRRDRGQPVQSPGARAIMRLCRELLERGGGYLTAVDKQTQLSDEHRARCVEVDPEKVPASLGAESYPVTKERSWGGSRSGEMDWAATAAAAAERKRSGD
jgi:DNA primase